MAAQQLQVMAHLAVDELGQVVMRIDVACTVYAMDFLHDMLKINIVVFLDAL
jgi:hypothetical protein